MTTEEQLWWRFKDIQDKINSLSSIVQNPAGNYKVPAEELAKWIGDANSVSNHLVNLITDTQTFLRTSNAKDI